MNDGKNSKEPRKNYPRKVPIAIFISLGILFTLFHFKILQLPKNLFPNKEVTKWKFKVKKNRPMPNFLCKASTYYKFVATGDINEITIDGISYNTPHYIGFFTSFPCDTSIHLAFQLDGIFVKSGYVNISKELNAGYPRMLYLQTEEYSSFYVEVSKCMRIDLPEQRELYYLAVFENGNLAREQLMMNNQNYSLRFYNSSQLKFKAAEIDFPLIIAQNPYFEEMELSYGNKYKRQDVVLKKSFYLNTGDIVITKFWLDKGDWVNFPNINSPEKIYCRIDTKNSRWKELGVRENYYFYQRMYEADKSGYLALKAASQIPITKIEIEHKKKWSLPLKNGEIYKIPVYRDDVYLLSSKSRFYFYDQLLNANVTYTYKSPADGHIKLMGSIIPDSIEVKVVSRRGY